MTKIAIILGSTRPGRKGEPAARWIYHTAAPGAATPTSSWPTWPTGNRRTRTDGGVRTGRKIAPSAAGDQDAAADTPVARDQPG